MLWELLSKRHKSTVDHFRANYSTPIWSLQSPWCETGDSSADYQAGRTDTQVGPQAGFRVLLMLTDLGTISRQRFSHSRRNTNKSTLKKKH